mgnify:CR=1 FL=1
MDANCQVNINGQWHDAKWSRRKKTCRRTWHVVQLVVDREGHDTLLIPAGGMYVPRSWIRGLHE